MILLVLLQERRRHCTTQPPLRAVASSAASPSSCTGNYSALLAVPCRQDIAPHGCLRGPQRAGSVQAPAQARLRRLSCCSSYTSSQTSSSPTSTTTTTTTFRACPRGLLALRSKGLEWRQRQQTGPLRGQGVARQGAAAGLAVPHAPPPAPAGHSSRRAPDLQSQLTFVPLLLVGMGVGELLVTRPVRQVLFKFLLLLPLLVLMEVLLVLLLPALLPQACNPHVTARKPHRRLASTLAHVLLLTLPLSPRIPHAARGPKASPARPNCAAQHPLVPSSRTVHKTTRAHAPQGDLPGAVLVGQMVVPKLVALALVVLQCIQGNPGAPATPRGRCKGRLFHLVTLCTLTVLVPLSRPAVNGGHATRGQRLIRVRARRRCWNRLGRRSSGGGGGVGWCCVDAGPVSHKRQMGIPAARHAAGHYPGRAARAAGW